MFKKILENRKKNIENRHLLIKNKIVYILFSIFYSHTSKAQCAMCRASLESEGNAVKAEAVNDGIVYLMIIPYILVALIGYTVYRMYQKKQE
jgi:hypothetical protein